MNKPWATYSKCTILCVVALHAGSSYGGSAIATTTVVSANEITVSCDSPTSTRSELHAGRKTLNTCTITNKGTKANVQVTTPGGTQGPLQNVVTYTGANTDQKLQGTLGPMLEDGGSWATGKNGGITTGAPLDTNGTAKLTITHVGDAPLPDVYSVTIHALSAMD